VAAKLAAITDQGGHMRKKLLLSVGVTALMAGPGAGIARADFVCPVLNVPAQAAANSPKIDALPTAGQYTVSGPTLQNGVPDGATNRDGTGSPADHASPGEPGYSPIWNTP
jgi:hypothetical protein